MIKRPFDHSGVAQVQTTILALPLPQKELELLELKNSFDSWINKWFDLEPSQQLQIQQMDQLFRQQLGTAIANNYATGLALNFTKEEIRIDQVPDKKEVVVHGLEQWQDLIQDPASDLLSIPLMIRIQYRYMN